MGNVQPGGSDPLVQAQDIGVLRNERWIFRHFDLKVERGELVFLIGANGAGKSTCAKAVLGLVGIDEGTLRHAPSMEIGYVPQRLSISPTMPLSLRRLITLTDSFPARDIETALEAVGLGRLGNPAVATLSGGEFQRLLLARALLQRPDLLVLDEPGQGIDVAGSDVLHNLIDDIRRELGCGILLISHDIKRAMDFGDDVFVLVPHEQDDLAASLAEGGARGAGPSDTAART